MWLQASYSVVNPWKEEKIRGKYFMFKNKTKNILLLDSKATLKLFSVLESLIHRLSSKTKLLNIVPGFPGSLPTLVIKCHPI